MNDKSINNATMNLIQKFVNSPIRKFAKLLNIKKHFNSVDPNSKANKFIKTIPMGDENVLNIFLRSLYNSGLCVILCGLCVNPKAE